MPANSRIARRYARTAAADDVGARRRREAAVAPGHGEARGEPLEVPLPRARKRLVEVVEVEDQRASGAANPPKFDRCASPHIWARSPLTGVAARSAAMIAAAPRKNVNGETSIRP